MELIDKVLNFMADNLGGYGEHKSALSLLSSSSGVPPTKLRYFIEGKRDLNDHHKDQLLFFLETWVANKALDIVKDVIEKEIK